MADFVKTQDFQHQYVQLKRTMKAIDGDLSISVLFSTKIYFIEWIFFSSSKKSILFSNKFTSSMSLSYFDCFSFFNTLSFIVSSVNKILLASVCVFLNSFLVQSQFPPRLLDFFTSLFLSGVIEVFFKIFSLANFLSISSSLSKVSYLKFLPSYCTYLTTLLICFGCGILDLFVLLFIFESITLISLIISSFLTCFLSFLTQKAFVPSRCLI